MFEKEVFTQQVALTELSAKNEICKRVKFEAIKFDIKIRIKQAISKKELETKNVEKLEVEEIFQQFDEY